MVPNKPCAEQNWRPAAVLTYTVNADTQLVIQQYEGHVPEKLTNCTVIDKWNWESKGTNGVAYVDGTRVEHPAVLDDMARLFHTKQVKRYEWLLATYAPAVQSSGR